MFTVEQIESEHSKIKTGAEFPKYIRALKEIGVVAFETWVKDSHTNYFGRNDFQTRSNPQYEELSIANDCDKDRFIKYLRIHQKGETDYFTFCKHCAETGIEKWIVDLYQNTCSYYNIVGNEILVEIVPTA